MTIIELIERTDPRLGRHVRHDPRSRDYAFLATPGLRLVDVEHARHIPILDQGQLGSCTGNAAVGALGSGVLWNALQSDLSSPPALNEALAVSVYSGATRLDNVKGFYPPKDTGSDGLSVAKVAMARGWISGYRHAFSLDDFLAALQKQPVIVGTRWYKSMSTPGPDGRLNVDPKSGVAGGHEYVARRYRAAERLIGFDNSWGTGWGDQGSFWITVDDFRRLLAAKGDATIFTPLDEPAPSPHPMSQSVGGFGSGIVKRWAALIARLRALLR